MYSGSPVDVGITMHVSSVSSISEVNMVRLNSYCNEYCCIYLLVFLEYHNTAECALMAPALQ